MALIHALAQKGIIMAIMSDANRYGFISRLFHWVMAVGFLLMIIGGMVFGSLDFKDPQWATAKLMHTSTGVVMGVLLVARLLWRLVDEKPSLDFEAPNMRMVANLTHKLLYVLFLTLVILGYIGATAHGKGLSWYNVVTLPSVVTDMELGKTARHYHGIVAFSLLGLVGLHVAAALKHHFINKNNVLMRMLKG